MTNRPFVSIIVPVYNGERTIAACIESLPAQDYPKDRYEVIVVDNGSTDGTKEVCMEQGAWRMENHDTPRPAPHAPCYYVFEPVRGSYKARNTGIKAARGEILAFTDADCVADKEWLKRGVEGFSDENVGCAAGEIEGYEPSNYVEQYLVDKKELSQEKTLTEALMPYAKTANVFYRKEVFDEIGLFEEKWVSGGDADMAWRMQNETGFKIKYIHKAIVFHKHRSTLRTMFSQCVTWGLGDTLLFKKYRAKTNDRAFLKKIWVLVHALDCIFRILPFLLSSKKEDITKEKINTNLDRLSFIGWEWGRIVGSIKNKVFYL